MTSEDFPRITEWFNGQTIFLTGASGFLGKVLLHKWLKSCPGIDVIYVLLRPKRGKTSKERLDDLFSSPIFEEFKLKNPELLKKVHMVEGDVAKKYLGMQESDWKMLQECVTLVFNAAASVRFDDPLQKAIFTNTRSTKDAILLAKGMKNLKSFVHVSTAYTNCNFLHIKEEVVPINFDPQKLITAAEKMNEYELEIFSEKIKGDYPNTYIFTKNIAEVLVYKEKHDLPVVIYRPAIIVNGVKEPEPGWCDTLNGLTALMGAIGKGIIRVFVSRKDHNVDLVTVDACVNGMIVSAWYRNVYLPIKKIPIENNIIFNATDVKLSQSTMFSFFIKYIYSYPIKQLWTVIYWPTPNILLYKILNIFLHIIPSLVIDGILKMTGKKPKLMKIYRKLYSAFLDLAHFTCNNWTFDTNNFARLKNIVPEDEQKTFFIDSLFETNVEGFMANSYRGTRHLLGDSIEFTKQDLERTIRLYWIDKILWLTLFGLFLWILPLKKTWDWSLDLVEEYQEAWNKLEEEYLYEKESRRIYLT